MTAAERLPDPLAAIRGTGLAVIRTTDHSPLHEGDVLSAINGHRLFARSDLTWRLFEQPRATYDATVNGHSLQLTRMELGSVDVVPTADFAITSNALAPDAKIEGDSAGLAYALGILLQRRQISGPSCPVVVTGAITFDGQVAPIGSAALKAYATLNSDACMMIVPRYNAPAIRAIIGDRIRVVAVCTLNQAIDALAVAPRPPVRPVGSSPCGEP